MQMPNRGYTASGSYRYGFNGKENDNEVKGVGSQIDYGMRVYDPRIGKFLSTDPLTKKFPDLTPYQFASNTPIAAIDIDGKEAELAPWLVALYNTALIKLNNSKESAVKNVNEFNAASNDNYGKFDRSKPIEDQVAENQKKAAVTKMGLYTKAAKAAAIGEGAAATPFLATAGVAALPELFVVSGSSQISLGSYLTHRTVDAFIDASSQKIINGKVDWADVVSNYVPVKGQFTKLIVQAFKSTVDYEDGELKTVFNDRKGLDAAAADAFADLATEKLFGRFNEALKTAFEKKGIKGEKLTQALGEVVKSEAKFVEETLKNGISRTTKELTETKKNE